MSRRPQVVNTARLFFTVSFHASFPRLFVVPHGFSSRTNLRDSISKTLTRITTPARVSSTTLTCTTFRSAVGR